MGALAGISPIVFPLDVSGLLSELDANVAKLEQPEARAGCPEFVGCASPDPMAPCPADCITLPLQEQYRCNWPPIFYPCRLPQADAGDNYKDERKRWKWKCPGEINYISCGPWYAINCCQVYDPGEGCAGGSGLVVCEGIPPGY